jgi:hypothetical protein
MQEVFGSLAIIVTRVTTDPLALRPGLSPGLPLSDLLSQCIMMLSPAARIRLCIAVFSAFQKRKVGASPWGKMSPAFAQEVRASGRSTIDLNLRACSGPGSAPRMILTTWLRMPNQKRTAESPIRLSAVRPESRPLL